MRIALAAAGAALALAACDAGPGGEGIDGGDDIDGGDGGSAVSIVTLATSPAPVVAVAFDVDSIYWTAEDDQIYRIPRSGGAPQPLLASSDAGWLGQIALDATGIYFTFLASDGTGGTVRRVDRAGGTATVAVGGFGPGDLFAMASVDGSVVYATTRELWRVIPGGSEKIADLPGLATGLTGAGGFLYTGTGASERTSSVVRVPLTGGTPQTVASQLANPTGVAVDGDTVYFTDRWLDRVHRVAAAGGPVTVLVDGDDQCAGIAVSVGKLYYASTFAGYGTLRVLTADGTPLTIYRGDHLIGPFGDAAGVFWFDGERAMTFAP